MKNETLENDKLRKWKTENEKMEMTQTDKSLTTILLLVQYCTNQSVVPGPKLECVYHLLRLFGVTDVLSFLKTRTWVSKRKNDIQIQSCQKYIPAVFHPGELLT